MVVELASLAEHLRSHPALAAKAEIGLVSDVLGPGSWVHGPGDDGAVVSSGADGHVIACGEALLPAFVAGDPYGAGIAAVLTNVNDLAAMGAVPLGIVDTIVGTAEVAAEVLRGLREAAGWYDVPLVGGHLTVHDGPPSLSAFGVGRAPAVLSSTHARPGQELVVASVLAGSMRTDFPFFRSFEQRSTLLGGDIRVLAQVAADGSAVAAKDVSMAGLVGSLAMLLEYGALGVTVDLNHLPRPDGVDLPMWLTCFPAYSFLLCSPPDRVAECLSAFTDRGIAAARVGTLDDSGELALSAGSERSVVLDLRTTGVTNLAR